MRHVPVLLLVLLIAAVPADALAGPDDPAVLKAIQRAEQRVYATTTGCRSARVTRKLPTFTDGEPSAAMLATLGALRRPQTPEDVLPDAAYRHVVADGIYRRFIRMARTAAGEYFLVPARNTHLYVPRPRRCVTALRRAFTREIRKDGRAFRRAARRRLERLIRVDWAGKANGPKEGVFLFTRRSWGLTGHGGVSLDVIRARGVFDWDQVGETTIVNGIVPDGVTAFDMTFPPLRLPPSDPKARRYAKQLTVTASVTGNVVAVAADRPSFAVFDARMAWRGPDGSIVKTLGWK